MESLSAKELFDLGEDYRTELPGLWAILRGRGSEVRIAQLLGWPIHKVRAEMARLEVAGIVTKNTIGTWMLDKRSEKYETYKVVRILYQKVDRKLAEEFPAQIELGELSAVVRSDARAAKKSTGAKGPEPTEKQLHLLGVIHKAFGRAQFTPLALGRAQGYTQAGWSKKYLETMSKKGFVIQVESPGRGTQWMLTDAGVGRVTR